MNTQYGLSLLHEINTSVIYLMGLSFVMGSLFTVLLLIIFDWVRSRNIESQGD